MTTSDPGPGTRFTVKPQIQELPLPPDQCPREIPILNGRLTLVPRQNFVSFSQYTATAFQRHRHRWATTVMGLQIAIQVFELGPDRVFTWEAQVGTKRCRHTSQEFVTFWLEARLRTLGNTLVGLGKKP